MPHEPLTDLAAAVRAFMVSHHETQVQFARRLGWTQGRLSTVLRRLERSAVDWPTAEKLAAAVGYELRLVEKEQKT